MTLRRWGGGLKEIGRSSENKNIRSGKALVSVMLAVVAVFVSLILCGAARAQAPPSGGELVVESMPALAFLGVFSFWVCITIVAGVVFISWYLKNRGIGSLSSIFCDPTSTGDGLPLTEGEVKDYWGLYRKFSKAGKFTGCKNLPRKYFTQVRRLLDKNDKDHKKMLDKLKTVIAHLGPPEFYQKFNELTGRGLNANNNGQKHIYFNPDIKDDSVKILEEFLHELHAITFLEAATHIENKNFAAGLVQPVKRIGDSTREKLVSVPCIEELAAEQEDFNHTLDTVVPQHRNDVNIGDIYSTTNRHASCIVGQMLNHGSVQEPLKQLGVETFVQNLNILGLSEEALIKLSAVVNQGKKADGSSYL